MTRLKLLGGPAEDLQGIVISADEDIDHAAHDQAEVRLRATAQHRQANWFANPDSPAHKLAYALALIEWGAWTGNHQAQVHAGKLYQECR